MGDEPLRPDRQAALDDVLRTFAEAGHSRAVLVERSAELTAQLAAAFADEIGALVDVAAVVARRHRLDGYFLTWLAQQVAAGAGSPWFGAAAIQFGRAQLSTAREDLGYDSLERGYLALRDVGGPSSPLATYARAALREAALLLGRTTATTRYADVNPAADNTYVAFAWLDLCGEHRGLTRTDDARLAALASGTDPLTAVVATRHRGYLASGRGDDAGAVQLFTTALATARAAALDTEIGHLLRSLAHAAQRSGDARAAVRHLSDACRHDAHPLAAYWLGLDLRMLGSAWLRLHPDDPVALRNADDAYRAGRQVLQQHLRVDTYLPLSRESVLQVMRWSGDDAVQVAALLAGASDLFAEFDLQAPGDALDALVEFEAFRAATASGTGDAATATYLDDRAVFARRFQHAEQDVDAYLDALPDERPARARHAGARLGVTRRFDQLESSRAVTELFAFDRPDVVYLNVLVGDSRFSAGFIDGTGRLLSFGGADLGDTELRAAHQRYRDALPSPRQLKLNLGVTAAEQALDELLTTYAQWLAPILEPTLPLLRGRQLVVLPRSVLNQVPLHALPVGDGRLIDVCDVGYAQSAGMLVRAHAGHRAPGRTTVVTGPGLGLLGALVPRLAGADGTVLADPDPDSLSSALGSTGSLVFACHGAYDPTDPGASELRFGPGGATSMARLFGRLDLRGCDTAVLAACESALGRSEIASEFIGLSSVFAAAGVRHVVGALWRVNQLAATVLLDRFVALQRTRPTVAALNAAQRDVAALTRDGLSAWLHDALPSSADALAPVVARLGEQPFAHPRLWAGLYVQGGL